MSEVYQNITGNTAVRIDLEVNKDYNYNHISICNIHSSDGVVIDLYLQYKTYENSRNKVDELNDFSDIAETIESYHILKNLRLDYATTLILTEEDFFINNLKYKLFIKLNNADSAVDVMVFDLKHALKNKKSTNRFKQDLAYPFRKKANNEGNLSESSSSSTEGMGGY